MLIGYGRVSTDSQSTAAQVDALIKAGCERVFEESASGRKADRPQLLAAMEFMRAGDTLVIVSLSRLARTMSQLLFTMDDLQARGIALKSLTENIDTTTASGRLIFHFFAALAHWEVELIRDRTKVALAARQKMGKTGGRPKALSDDQVKAVKALLASGDLSIPQIAKQIGCSISTIYRYAPGGKSSVQTAN